MTIPVIKDYIQNLEFQHVYDGLMSIFKEVNCNMVYSKENLQTFAVTIHPSLPLFLSALTLSGIGGDLIRDNAMEEMFGTGLGEGNHSMLCIKYFNQLGPYKIEHYTRCFQSLQKVYEICMTKKNLPILYAFLCCGELFDKFFSKTEEIVKSFVPEKEYDDLYIRAHREADNHEEGHGVKMLKYLEKEKFMTVDQFNQGVQLWCDMVFDLFGYTGGDGNGNF
eukprot:gene11542-14136_t